MSSSRHAPNLEQVGRWVTDRAGVTDGVNRSLHERNRSLAYFARRDRFVLTFTFRPKQEGVMVVKQRAGLLLSGTVLASIFVTAPAFAQDAQTDQMQRQINALQKQLQTLQSQVTETKQQAKAAQESAQTAQQSAQIAQRPSRISCRPLQRRCRVADQGGGGSLLVRGDPRVLGRQLHRDGRCVAPAQRSLLRRQRSALQHTAVSQLSCSISRTRTDTAPNRAASPSRLRATSTRRSI